MRLLKKKQQHTEEAPLGASVPLPAVVRVRMLRKAFTAWGFMEPGRTVNVPRGVARHWMDEGLAEMDKSLDGPPETK